MGYHQAGFEVVGIDINQQPHYPFEFHQGDALEYLEEHGHEFDVIHASPPCQKFSQLTRLRGKPKNHPNLINATRDLLAVSGKPYVIENVVGAPLRCDLVLCGTMFGLRMARHRIFETNVQMPLLTTICKHYKLYDPYHGGEMSRGEREKNAEAIGITWFVTRPEVRQAIPPAYTKFIGEMIRSDHEPPRR